MRIAASTAFVVSDIVQRPAAATDAESRLTQEWLVTNGLGGYAGGTVAGVPTRRYHGLLIAALPVPLGRFVMVGHLGERVRLPDGTTAVLGGAESREAALDLPGLRALREFGLEDGLPVWRYEWRDVALEKRVLMPYRQNTVHVSYRLLSGSGPVLLSLQPFVGLRSLHAPVSEEFVTARDAVAMGDRFELSPGPALPTLRVQVSGEHAAFAPQLERLEELFYRSEAHRGYPATGGLWSPGAFRVEVAPTRTAALVASTESWETMAALAPEEALAAEQGRRRRLILAAHPVARAGLAAELVLAADQFIIVPSGRVLDIARPHAAGDEPRTVVAGYHWFTDWGRDTMISLEGLTLATGRIAEAGSILRTFARHVRDGLLPNLFPEGDEEGRYHTADATLWFFHALDRYVEASADGETLALLRPLLADIVRHHLEGTRFGIGVDPADGLLRQGHPDYPLTWMDAKVDDWIVTPRRGKAVEINALWYNALRLLEEWTRQAGDQAAARPLAVHAERARTAFNRRFWYAAGGHLYDVVDGERGDDPSCRPNQVLAIALRHPVLAEERWSAVLDVVRSRLLTPCGLRTLAPDDAAYAPRYDGDLRARDAAYHQGTVWPWLLGPFVDAWLRVHDDRKAARAFLEGLAPHLAQACIGSVSEIFDAQDPFTPRGCVAQAWSVAEALRSWIGTEP
jgi:predicted glycogen debranching enzyme